MKSSRLPFLVLGLSLGVVVSYLLCQSINDATGTRQEVQSQSQSHLVKSSNVVESIHSALILSNIPKSAERSVRYLGATTFDRPPPGYYQYLPGTWQLGAQNADSERIQVYLSISKDGKSGFDVMLRGFGTVNLVAKIAGSEKSEHEVENTVLDVGYGRVSLRESLQKIFLDFQNAQYEYEYGIAD